MIVESKNFYLKCCLSWTPWDVKVWNAYSGLPVVLLQKDLVVSLTPQLKGEKRDGSSASDPYVAFRRRTEKMQTRKVDSLFSILIVLYCFIQMKILIQQLYMVWKLCVYLWPKLWSCFCRIVRMTRLHMRRCSNFEEIWIELVQFWIW